ncbi:MAG: hypothetical protein CM1200mP32_12580 [Methanobacteriota archaeon]|nr:MAG: hypothetical protein CM1200mP32_12580 [Euryarchaeota archaeon]
MLRDTGREARRLAVGGDSMPERRICSFTHEEIDPGTGMMFIKRDGSVFWFKDSKARKNMLKLKRNPRRLKWTRRYEKGGIK